MGREGGSYQVAHHYLPTGDQLDPLRQHYRTGLGLGLVFGRDERCSRCLGWLGRWLFRIGRLGRTSCLYFLCFFLIVTEMLTWNELEIVRI
jgi:hypothetical protein